MVNQPDLTAEETSGLEGDFAAETPQVVSGGVALERRQFLKVLAAGAAGVVVANSVSAGEPVKVAANAKGTSSVATKEGEREAALNEWRRKHIVKKPDDYVKEIDPVLESARQSHEAEKAYYASMLKPEKYKREYPNGVYSSDWGSEGKIDVDSTIHYVIFRVTIVDADGTPVKPTTKEATDNKKKEALWMSIGMSKITADANAKTNPDGICASITLDPDALKSVQAVEAALKGSNFVIPRDGLAKK